MRQDAVIELSKMMRYVLYESGHEAITLEKDIQFMENYIKLMRIRYTEDVDIRFDYPNDLPHDVTIPPLLLIVFVENAFKHGISYSRPSFIHIRVRYIDGKVYYSIINSRHTAEPSGKDAGHRPGKRPAAVAADLRQPPHARDRHPPAQHVSCQTHHPRYLP